MNNRLYKVTTCEQPLQSSENANDDNAHLYDLVKALSKYKLMVFIIIASMTAIAAIISFFLPPVYRAEVVVSPSIEIYGTNNIPPLGGLSGLANIAGIRLSNQNDQIGEAIATLRSRDFTISFIKDEKIISVFKNKTDKHYSELSAYYLFNEIRTINIDTKTGMIVVSIEWNDPKQAAEWANELISKVNKKMRDEAITKSQKIITLLESELENTNVMPVKEAIKNMIEDQFKKKMLASTLDEYAFHVVDKAVVPEEKVKPKRFIIILIGLVMGCILSLAVVILLNISNRYISVNHKYSER